MNEHSEASVAQPNPGNARRARVLAFAPASANLLFFNALAFVPATSDFDALFRFSIPLFEAIIFLSVIVGLIGSVVGIRATGEERRFAWLGLLINSGIVLVVWPLLVVCRII